MLFYNLIPFLARFFRAVQQRLLQRNDTTKEWTEIEAETSAIDAFLTGKRGSEYARRRPP